MDGLLNNFRDLQDILRRNMKIKFPGYSVRSSIPENEHFSFLFEFAFLLLRCTRLQNASDPSAYKFFVWNLKYTISCVLTLESWLKFIQIFCWLEFWFPFTSIEVRGRRNIYCCTQARIISTLWLGKERAKLYRGERRKKSWLLSKPVAETMQRESPHTLNIFLPLFLSQDIHILAQASIYIYLYGLDAIAKRVLCTTVLLDFYRNTPSPERIPHIPRQ